MTTSPLTAALADYDNNFTANWNRVFSKLQTPECSNEVMFAGPTSYVFSLCGQKFAVDLQIRRSCDFEALKPHLLEQLSQLRFMLITHEHDDHMCLPIMNLLRDTDIHWYIPSESKRELVYSSGLKDENITWVQRGASFRIGELDISAFYSPHVSDPSEKFDQRGYLITSPKLKILMPGDVRNYNYDGYPDFGELDLCFSHVWAGNDALNAENYMPMIEKFAAFNAKFRAKKYLLCHLYEVGREEKYLWHYGHAGIAMKLMYEAIPESIVEVPRIGCSYALMQGGDK